MISFYQQQLVVLFTGKLQATAVFSPKHEKLTSFMNEFMNDEDHDALSSPSLYIRVFVCWMKDIRGTLQRNERNKRLMLCARKRKDRTINNI